jgi:hypothetical protein
MVQWIKVIIITQRWRVFYAGPREYAIGITAVPTALIKISSFKVYDTLYSASAVEELKSSVRSSRTSRESQWLVVSRV